MVDRNGQTPPWEDRDGNGSGRRYKHVMPQIITVASDSDLRNQGYLKLLSIAYWSFQVDGKYASRRTVADIVSNVLRDYEGEFQLPDGTPFAVDDVDELLGGPHFDWVRYFFATALESEAWNFEPVMLDRLRALDAAAKAGGPILWRGLLR